MLQEAEAAALLQKQQQAAVREAALEALRAVPDDAWKLWQQVRRPLPSQGCTCLVQDKRGIAAEKVEKQEQQHYEPDG